MAYVRGSWKSSKADWPMMQEEIRARNQAAIFLLAVVALPIMLVVIGFFYQDLLTSTGVEYAWRKAVLSMLYCLLAIFATSGMVAFYCRARQNSRQWAIDLLSYGIPLCLPIIGAVIACFDQRVTPSINAYFIFCVIPSLVILSPPKRTFLCFVVGYAVFYWLLPSYQPSAEILLSNRANGLAATTAGYTLSLLLWRANLIKFRQHRQIILQKQEIEAHREELEASYEKLQEAYAANQKFFSIISHDLRGPLNSTVQLSELLANGRDYLPQEKKDHMLQLLYASLGKTSKLLDNLLTWARAQTDSMPFKPVQLNVRQVVLETTELLQAMATEKSISLHYAIPAHLTIKADKEMVCTVIRNLVSNALKFTHDKGRVCIAAEQVGAPDGNAQAIRLTVQDTGIGMSQEKVSQLFKVGNRVTTPGTRREAGTGLGLILSKEFVEKHGGTITATSAPAEGSTFSVTFPCAAAVRAPRA
ncbi:sensor histidine kinase [Rufibacter psychrotolerans]|uniref:sensor histidine kinase n=1 Tax=Rufibacter psychrotolerans TaxID=2812556 RepID=UPI001967B5A7|nr:HAMP domain-containing sensor histidine kinase [Rufibacter sp. SYSU D00308]